MSQLELKTTEGREQIDNQSQEFGAKGAVAVKKDCVEFTAVEDAYPPFKIDGLALPVEERVINEYCLFASYKQQEKKSTYTRGESAEIVALFKDDDGWHLEEIQTPLPQPTTTTKGEYQASTVTGIEIKTVKNYSTNRDEHSRTRYKILPEFAAEHEQAFILQWDEKMGDDIETGLSRSRKNKVAYHMQKKD